MAAHNTSRLGTPLSSSATKVMLLGSGELGKEVIIALQRLGVESSRWIATRMRRGIRWRTVRISSTWLTAPRCVP